MNSGFELVPLHHHKHHLDDCCAILNAEWPRSKAARDHSLNKSCDGLPCCLVYRRVDSQQVVGFCQVVAVQGKDHACLIESVIIRHDLRGTGLGRKLMEASEQFVKERNLKSVYLNTLDKEGFYSHLGYSRCGPVTSLGANASRVPDAFLQKLTGWSGESSSQQTSRENCTNSAAVVTCTSSPSSPVPALSESPSSPPLPPPPPPLPPPPPPPQSSRNTSLDKSALSRHVMRMDPSAVTWMCKEL